MTSINRSMFTPTVFRMLERTSYPEEWSVIWAEEPLRFTFHNSSVRYALNWQVPAHLGRLDSTENVDAAYVESEIRLGHLLICAAAPQETRLVAEPLAMSAKVGAPLGEASLNDDPDVKFISPSGFNLFRPVASGGGLFPWEIYVIWCGSGGLPAGVYRYDPAHHQLEAIGRNVADLDMEKILPGINDLDSIRSIVLVTVVHWKNYFKYGNACVHLHGLDVGILSSAIAILAPKFGFTPSFRPHIVVTTAAPLLGIDPERKSVIAVLTLHEDSTLLQSQKPLSPIINPIQANTVRSTPFPRCAAAILLDRATKVSDPAHLQFDSTAPAASWGAEDHIYVTLPKSKDCGTLDLAEVFRNRRSGIDPWHLKAVSLDFFAHICRYATGYQEGYVTLDPDLASCIGLFSACHAVTGVPIGFYRYDSVEDRLVSRMSSDAETLQTALQSSYFLGNVNFGTASVVFAVFADLDRAFAGYGDRAFRLLDLAAGWVVQRIITATGAAGLGSHAIYGFDSVKLRGLFRMVPNRHGLLLSVAVGARPQHVVSLPLPFWL